MSREIKFRIWRAPDEYSKTSWMESWDSLMNYSMSDIFQLDNPHDVLEQFTGLKDKNGKDIYEGDILAWHSNIYRKHDWVGLVLYRGAGFAVQESDKSYSSPEWLDCACRKDANIIEVIGNVHENPELLEEEK
ncbi:YopX protein [Lentilactobacillus parabuchneri]|uniref:YopX family protein n=1 Tax=Lentilactobacillus parabuchneri TaxID=152331 RepID=UPI000A24823D|nr:YopX family protein [Lentilactobacillus parabuchneri]MDB1104842.1 YopX family protein [Lentilactobacillus parabuchneri]ORN10648.1 YopX protein [Lentilactobacillus parabuchneri]ORN39579.1 YopX protein [Lentilactobacillus parabuchneri]